MRETAFDALIFERELRESDECECVKVNAMERLEVEPRESARPRAREKHVTLQYERDDVAHTHIRALTSRHSSADAAAALDRAKIKKGRFRVHLIE